MQTASKHRLFNSIYLVIFIAGIGFFALSFLLLGILPGQTLQKEIDSRAPANMLPYTAKEERGRIIYAREGCGYCHTQQVRFIAQDVARWGYPTEAWETKFDYPQLWGTRRIGPDLARETGVRSNDWHLTHLFDPRYVVRDSIMPGYPWLFKGAADKPTEDGIALVAYLQSLGKARVVSGYDNALQLPVPKAQETEHTMTMDNSVASNMTTSLNPRQDAIAARAQLDGPIPGFIMPNTAVDNMVALHQGQAAFAENCAGCHGDKGAGNGLAATSLLPRPANLRDTRINGELLADVLWNGRVGSAMPAWRDLDEATLASLSVYVQSLHKPVIEPSRPDETATGKLLFAKNCASCHGGSGQGDGPVARSLSPRPANFLLKRGNTAYLEEIVRKGIPGSAMPPWESALSEQQRSAIVTYIRTLYLSPEQKD